jgi:PAS domain S-box-containing protein
MSSGAADTRETAPPIAPECDSVPVIDRLDPRDVDHSINQRIFETSLDLILVVDRRGGIVRVSPSAKTILGYEPAEIIGCNGKELVFIDDLESTREEMRLARRGREVRNFKCRYMHKDGTVVPLAWTGLWSEADQQHFFIGRDMTEQLKLEHQLRHAQKMEAIGRLTGGIAHDFNNILTVIIGMSDLLGEAVAGEPTLHALVQSIDEAAERGTQLTQRMLAFARKQPLQARAIDLNEAVLRTTAVLKRTLGEDIKVATDLANGLWTASADPSQAEDAILNLAVNARDAMPNGGFLLIETANVHLDSHYAEAHADVIPGDYVAIVVTDSGGGMAPETIERAFEPFFTTKEVGHGTGLGLSMVYGFMKQSRGHVKIYSELGHGTSIKLYFPRATDPGAAATPATGTQSGRDLTGRENILVVEDDRAVRELAVGALRNLGYNVCEAEDGRAALAILQGSIEVDLLFTDLVMPNGISGQELLRRAREQRPHLKAIFASGYSETFVNGGGASAPGVPLLNKPYRKQSMAELVRKVLDAKD